MSTTLSAVRLRAKYHLRDRDSSPAFTIPEYNVAVDSQMRLMAPALVLGDGWTLGAVVTAPGTDTYVLPGAQEYGIVAKFRLQDTGLEVEVKSLEEFEQWRRGSVAANPPRSIPLVAMLIESATQVLSVRFWPVPDKVYTLDLYSSLLPAALTADTSVIPFDAEAAEALSYSVALELYNRMEDQVRQKCGLGDNASANWPGNVAAGIKASRVRRLHQLGGRRVRRGRRW